MVHVIFAVISVISVMISVIFAVILAISMVISVISVNRLTAYKPYWFSWVGYI